MSGDTTVTQQSALDTPLAPRESGATARPAAAAGKGPDVIDAIGELVASGAGSTTGDSDPGELIQRALELAQKQLGMDIAFISEWHSGKQTFRYLAGDTELFGLETGDGTMLCDAYCERVYQGELPAVIPDSTADPVAARVPARTLLGIGAYIGAPIEFSTGELFGMLCCLNRSPNPSLKEQDARFLKVLADLVAPFIEREKRDEEKLETKRARIQRVLDEKLIQVLLQPIVDLTTGKVVGAEALSRFQAEPHRSPDQWFTEAAEVGLGCELELKAAALAVQKLKDLGPGTYLSINVSPSTLIRCELRDLLQDVDAERIIIELTEHELATDPELLESRVRTLRSLGVRFAIDDAGAGYSGLARVLQLVPNKIKLDMGLTRNIDSDPAKRALASALMAFSQEVGAMIIAEGIENEAELRTIRQIGIRRGQGYHLHRPTDGRIPTKIDL